MILSASPVLASVHRSRVGENEIRDASLFFAGAANDQLDPPVVQNGPQGTSTLANGATAIFETYGDWTVQCRIVMDKRRCTLNQILANQETGQVEFAIELLPLVDGEVSGRVLSPLGTRLSDGLVLQIDNSVPVWKLQFAQCVSSGCIAFVRFDDANIDAMKAGTALMAQVTVETSGQPLNFQISLNGFAAALKRTTGLQ